MGYLILIILGYWFGGAVLGTVFAVVVLFAAFCFTVLAWSVPSDVHGYTCSCGAHYDRASDAWHCDENNHGAGAS